MTYTKESNIPIDWSRLELQSKLTDNSYRKESDKNRSCVFLDDSGACKVYEHRPSACRRHFVISDPKLCDITTSENLWRWGDPEVEAICSAAMNVSGVDGMAIQLLKLRQIKNI
jgi:Fe-S-cluster containining protein